MGGKGRKEGEKKKKKSGSARCLWVQQNAVQKLARLLANGTKRTPKKKQAKGCSSALKGAKGENYPDGGTLKKLNQRGSDNRKPFGEHPRRAKIP